MEKFFNNFRSFKTFKAFTLVELMIVIAIIGILSAVLYPSITGYFERARDTAKKSELNQINLGIISYNIDNGTYKIGTEKSIGWKKGGEKFGIGMGWVNYSDGNYSKTTILEYLKKSGYLKGNYKTYGVKDWNTIKYDNSNSPCKTEIRMKDGYWLLVSPNGNNYSLSAYLEKSSKPEDKDLLYPIGNEYHENWWLRPCQQYGRNYGIGN